MNRPNIIFINTDQHCWNAISAYGNPFVNTPNIDTLVNNGISFQKSYCTDPLCSPARASWMTGRYTSENGSVFNDMPLHSELKDAGQLLNSNGYYAAHCGKWHVAGRPVAESLHNLYNGKETITGGMAEYHDSVTTRAAINFLSCYTGDKPFFLEIGYINPHDICQYQHHFENKDMPDPIEQGIVTDNDIPPMPDNFTYDTNETVLNRTMRRIPDALYHAETNNTTSEWTQAQWRYHNLNYYRFIRIRKGIMDKDHFVCGVDILPTICHYANVELPEKVQGLSLRPLIEGWVDSWRSYAYVECAIWGRAIITDSCKYITEYIPNGPEEFMPPSHEQNKLGIEQLFDLERDPGETRNLACDPSYSQILTNLRHKLFEHESNLERTSVTDPGSCKIISQWAEQIIKYTKFVQK